jgi:hypothetical protein
MAWEMMGQGTRSIKRRTGKRSGKRGGLFPPQSKKEKKKAPIIDGGLEINLKG